MGGTASGEGTPGEPPKKQAWFEADRAHNTAHKTLKGTYDSTVSELTSVKDELKAAVDRVLALPAVEAKFFTGELAIAKNRMTCASKVLDTEAALVEYKKSVLSKAS